MIVSHTSFSHTSLIPLPRGSGRDSSRIRERDVHCHVPVRADVIVCLLNPISKGGFTVAAGVVLEALIGNSNSFNCLSRFLILFSRNLVHKFCSRQVIPNISYFDLSLKLSINSWASSFCFVIKTVRLSVILNLLKNPDAVYIVLFCKEPI